jgi:hypothetical protein
MHRDTDPPGRPTGPSVPRRNAAPAARSFAADLPALRQAVLLSASSAVRVLTRRLNAPDGWTRPADRVDATVLCAEALLRARQDAQAFHVADTALHDAGQMQPTDWPRLRTAYTVAMDIGHLTGEVTVAQLIEFFTAVADPQHRDSDPWTVHARALQAVAVYHDVSCNRGRTLLTELHSAVEHHRGPDDPLTASVATGLQAAARECAGFTTPPDPTPPPTPGGILHPDVSRPHPHYLAHRIAARAARHDHELAT